MKAKMQTVEVYWEDSKSNTAWEDINSRMKWGKHTSLLCRSVGMLLKHNKKRTMLAQSVGIDEQGVAWSVADTIIIPTPAIKSISEL